MNQSLHTTRPLLLLIAGGLLTVAIGFVTISTLMLDAKYEYKFDTEWLSEQHQFERLEWQALIPDHERSVLARYQSTDPNTIPGLTDQIIKTIEASGDFEYQQAMFSTNTVDSLNGRDIAVGGFVVPLDYYPNKDIKDMFVVPYFGACLHFPPPPPNQMMYVRLQPGFSDIDLEQAYLLKGKLSIELYEDIMGTSAYSLDVISIEKYTGTPDTFRQHDG